MKGENEMIISIFYSKITGEIYTATMAENKYTYDRFGKFAKDMEQILDILYISGNDGLYKDLKNYYIDLETKALIRKDDNIRYL